MTKNNATAVCFSQYMPILRAETVGIHNLLSFFKKSDIDYDKHGNIMINFKDDTAGTPILVAHLDNVLHGKREPVMDISGNTIFGKSAGIGFDDKAGIIAIIELWRRSKEKDFRIIFTADEEVGGIGATNLDYNLYADAAYIIELDRRGGKDLIQTSGCTRLCSDAFASLFACYGFKKDIGTFTDVNIFKQNAPFVNMVNLSIGYYNPHTDNEYLNIKEFQYIVDCVHDFLENHKETIVDDTPEELYDKNSWKNRSYDRYDRYDTYDMDDFDYYDEDGDMTTCYWCGTSLSPEDEVIKRADGVFCCKECAAEADKFYEKVSKQ